MSTENSLSQTQETKDGDRVMQGGRAGHHQGEVPTNKTKPPLTDHAAESEAQRKEAQPPEPLAPLEVQMLMEAQEGQHSEPDRGQQDGWREVKIKGKNKNKNPETLPSKKPCIIPPGLPKNPVSEENKWSNALSGTS